MIPIKQLRKILTRREKEISLLRSQIEDRENAAAIPELRKRFEGKYFRYKNTYSGDSEGWWIYIRCKRAVSIRKCLYDCFEISPNGCEFQVDKEGSYLICNEEISELEYVRAANRFIQIAANLL